MQILKTIFSTLAEHEEAHTNRPSFIINGVISKKASVKCKDCKQHFGFVA